MIKGVRKIVVSFSVLIINFFLASICFAHHPVFEKRDTNGFLDALVIPNPKISYLIYANLNSSDDIDFFRFDVNEPMKIYVDILVPYSEGYENFYPAYAILGPGLPPVDETIRTNLPFKIPPNYGAVVIIPKPLQSRPVIGPRPPSLKKTFWNMYYAGIPAFEQQINKPGSYYIVVWHPKGEIGTYQISFGKKEKWTFQELIKLIFKDMKKIRSGEWLIKKSSLKKTSLKSNKKSKRKEDKK